MPDTDGIEATRRLLASGGRSRVLMLTTFDADEYVYDAMKAGASGFLLKNAPPAQLVAAVRATAQGDAQHRAGDRAAHGGRVRPPPAARRDEAGRARPSSASASSMSSSSSRVDSATPRSPPPSSSARRRCARTSAGSSRSSTCATGRRRSSSPTRAASCDRATLIQCDVPIAAVSELIRTPAPNRQAEGHRLAGRRPLSPRRAARSRCRTALVGAGRVGLSRSRRRAAAPRATTTRRSQSSRGRADRRG